LAFVFDRNRPFLARRATGRRRPCAVSTSAAFVRWQRPARLYRPRVRFTRGEADPRNAFQACKPSPVATYGSGYGLVYGRSTVCGQRVNRVEVRSGTCCVALASLPRTQEASGLVVLAVSPTALRCTQRHGYRGCRAQATLQQFQTRSRLAQGPAKARKATFKSAAT